MYRIVFHKLVEEDLKKIDKSDVEKIFKTIEKKLMIDPISFGKPLIGELKGCRRLRIGIYRVVYRFDGEKVLVFILKIGFRRNSEVYMEAAKRINLPKVMC
ncbi:MAG: Plasmid stabilization system [uncultured bacterium]|nr:MAG: Plasmid stabilization system [uncultured bacterium]OGJ47829.1 MAG: hypothetical protein A2344_01545 [Candidatus Peregrinibacteria bacterium RIFOXYB12_FULL_41_12]OGJ52669.1 MAG: hypothetical protein A2336_02815 [Candidatus Peregrinibacteria bacterium RIFOXYB2_FULL_41_88]